MKEAWKDFWYFNGESILGFIVAILILAVLFSGFVKTSEMECNAKTQYIGFEHRWSFYGGCQIEVTDGQWIPLESYYFKQE